MEKILEYKNTEYKITVKINDVISITVSTYHDNKSIHKYYKKYELSFDDIIEDSEDNKLFDYINKYENEFKKYVDSKIYHEKLLKDNSFC